jgi:hypothetical protein
MSLDDLGADLEATYGDLDGELSVELDGETRRELAMLLAALDPEDADDLVRRGIHALFDRTVETGALDFHLRSAYDVTYDEYLSGMTYDEMAGGGYGAGAGRGANDDDDRRYQF